MFRLSRFRWLLFLLVVAVFAFVPAERRGDAGGLSAEDVLIAQLDPRKQKKLESRLKQLERDRATGETRLRREEQLLENEKNRKRRQLLERNITKLKSDLARIDDSIREVKMELGEGEEAEVLKDEDGRQDAKDSIVQLNSAIEDAQKKAKELEEERNKERKEKDKPIKEAEENLKKLRRDCSKAKAEADRKACEEKIAAAEKELEELVRRLRELDEQIAAQEELIKGLEIEKKIAELEELREKEQTPEVKKKIARCEKDLEGLRKELQELDNEPPGNPAEEDELTATLIGKIPGAGGPPSVPAKTAPVRMGTWNLRNLNETRAAAIGADIAATVKANRIDIIAMQEVHGSTITGSLQPPASLESAFTAAGYVLLPGQRVRQPFRNRKPDIEEMCPIAYDPAQLDCSYSKKPEENIHDTSKAFMHGLTDSNRRAMHSVYCRAKGAKATFDFVFSCVHFGTKSDDVDTNVKSVASNVKTLRFQSGENDIILAGDFNSHPRTGGHLQDKWGPLTGIGLELGPGNLLPALQFTKMYKSGGLLISKAERRQIDDLFWFKPTIEDYIADSKTVLYVMHTMFPGAGAGGAPFAAYFDAVSDHLPVVAEFHTDQDTD